MANLTPIQRKQRALMGGDPLGLARLAAVRHRVGLGYATLQGFGAAGNSVYSGPPIGAGARGGATTGAIQGASVGAVAGPIGAAIGAAIGAIGGAIAGSINKRDPEQANFDQAVALWQQNRLSVLNLSNLYLPLAGLFDLNLKNPHIPIYQKYGRMGEQKFVTDMLTKVYQAAQSGQIGPTDTAQTIMVKVVQPWIDSWGFGPMADPHADLINILMMGIIADYTAGREHTFLARGGDYPFGSLPKFSLPGGTAGSQAAQYAPGTSVATAPVSALSTSTANVPNTASSQSMPGNVAPQAPPVPTVMLSAPGSIVSAPGTGVTAGGNTWIYLGPQAPGDPNNAQGYPIWVNGQLTGYSVQLAAGVGGALYAVNAQGGYAQWNGSQWVSLPSAPALTPTANTAQSIPTTPPAGTTVTVPAGYTLIGSANGLAAYQGLDGNYYSWNGATMTPLTGLLTASNGQSANIVNGAVQASTTLSSPSLGSATQQTLPPPGYQSYAGAQPQPVASQGTPAVPAPTTAGVSGAGLPSWLTWGAVAAGAYFMLATARPVGKNKIRRSRK